VKRQSNGACGRSCSALSNAVSRLAKLCEEVPAEVNPKYCKKQKRAYCTARIEGRAGCPLLVAGAASSSTR
jgi:hypothetical protein